MLSDNATYRESKTEVILFSRINDEFREFNSKFRGHIDKKGVDYDGPVAPPKISPGHVREFLNHADNLESTEHGNADHYRLLDKISSSEDNVEMLHSASQGGSSISTRIYVIYDQNAVSSALSIDFPDSVFGTISTGYREHPVGSSQNSGTWDPNNDNVPSHPDATW